MKLNIILVMVLLYRNAGADPEGGPGSPDPPYCFGKHLAV